jgi:hypothetical protein
MGQQQGQRLKKKCKAANGIAPSLDNAMRENSPTKSA